jgi:NADH:ubiquinone oxidoreductase subunit E
MGRLDEVLAEYKGTAGALMPVLQQAQAIFGYLPESVMHRISDALGEPRSKVFGVVTFYSFFSTAPRGKHLVRVCLGTACYVLGAKEVLTALKEELGINVGQTTEDRMFSLAVGRCFGACGLAPVLTIDEDVHKRVRPGDIPDILATIRNRGAAEGEEKA